MPPVKFTKHGSGSIVVKILPSFSSAGSFVKRRLPSLPRLVVSIHSLMSFRCFSEVILGK